MLKIETLENFKDIYFNWFIVSTLQKKGGKADVKDIYNENLTNKIHLPLD